MKTVRQMARAAKVSRQMAYRYIKNNHIQPAGLDETGRRVYADDLAQGIIKNLAKKSRGSEPAMLTILRNQLTSKDNQIAELHKELNNQQALTANAQNLLAHNRQALIDSQSRALKLDTTNQRQSNQLKDNAAQIKRQADKISKQAADNAKLKAENKAQAEQLEKMRSASWLARLFGKW